MFNWFEKINYFYNTKMYTGERLWEIDRVKDAVRLNKVTKKQYKEITGEDYTN